MLTNPAYIFLWRDLAIFLLFGAVLGILLGSLLIFRPQFVERLNHVANRWISTRHINRWLDRSVSIEQWFYQHHRAVGAVVVLGAAYIFIYFGMLFDKPYILQHLSIRGMLPPNLLESLLDALVLGALVWGAVAFVVGLFLWLRPSLLRGMEEEANKWVSSRRATKVLEIPRDDADRFVMRHAQRVGWLILLASLYLFFIVFRLLA
jgi:hypothetical protein